MSIQTFSQDLTLPPLIEWFNGQDAVDRVIADTELYIIRVKAFEVAGEEGEESRTYFVISPTSDDYDSEDKYLGESVFMWIGPRGIDAISTAADWYELSKAVPNTATGTVSVVPFYSQVTIPNTPPVDLTKLFSISTTKDTIMYEFDAAAGTYSSPITVACHRTEPLKDNLLYYINTPSGTPILNIVSYTSSADGPLSAPGTISITGYPASYYLDQHASDYGGTSPDASTIAFTMVDGSTSTTKIAAIKLDYVNGTNAITEYTVLQTVQVQTVKVSRSGRWIVYVVYDGNQGLMYMTVIDTDNPSATMNRDLFTFGSSSGSYLEVDWGVDPDTEEDVLLWTGSGTHAATLTTASGIITPASQSLISDIPRSIYNNQRLHVSPSGEKVAILEEACSQELTMVTISDPAEFALTSNLPWGMVYMFWTHDETGYLIGDQYDMYKYPTTGGDLGMDREAVNWPTLTGKTYYGARSVATIATTNIPNPQDCELAL